VPVDCQFVADRRGTKATVSQRRGPQPTVILRPEELLCFHENACLTAVNLHYKLTERCGATDRSDSASKPIEEFRLPLESARGPWRLRPRPLTGMPDQYKRAWEAIP
jgi:hypothetical protein